MYVCVSVYSISVVPLEARGGIGSLNRELRMVVAIMWVQGIEPGSFGRTAEPSLQPQINKCNLRSLVCVCVYVCVKILFHRTLYLIFKMPL